MLEKTKKSVITYVVFSGSGKGNSSGRAHMSKEETDGARENFAFRFPDFSIINLKITTLFADAGSFTIGVFILKV